MANVADALSAAIEAHRKDQPCPLEDALILAHRTNRKVVTCKVYKEGGEFWLAVLHKDRSETIFKVEAGLPGLES